jgi:heme O synthase-like polyprenyltransferase
MLIASAWVIYSSVKFLNSESDRKIVLKTFVTINFYTLILITVFIADRLF